MVCPSGVALAGLMLKALREIGEGCSNGDVKKSSGKIQVMKIDRVRVSHDHIYLKRTYKELGYTTKVELVMLLASDASVILLASL